MLSITVGQFLALIAPALFAYFLGMLEGAENERAKTARLQKKS